MNREELHRYQQQFLANVLRSDTEPMSIYHHNMMGMRLRALASIFPTCMRVVGEACFNAVAMDYIRSTEMLSSSLDDDGQGFDLCWQTCVDTRPGFESLMYLPDLARFERTQHDVFCAPEDDLFDWQQVQVRSDAVDWSRAKPVLCAAFALFDSPWPLLRLFDQTCDGRRIWVHRRDGEVKQGELTDEMYELLSMVSQGATMETICQGEAQIAQLQEAVANGWIVALSSCDVQQCTKETSVESFT